MNVTKIAVVATAAGLQAGTAYMIGAFTAPVWAGIKFGISLGGSIAQEACSDHDFNKNRIPVMVGTAGLEAITSFIDWKLGCAGWGAIKAGITIAGAVAQEMVITDEPAVIVEPVASAPVVEPVVTTVATSVKSKPAQIKPVAKKFKFNFKMIAFFVCVIGFVIAGAFASVCGSSDHRPAYVPYDQSKVIGSKEVLEAVRKNQCAFQTVGHKC